MSFDRLIEKIVEKQNPTVAGLDPKLAYIPEYIKEESFKKYGKTLEGAADAILTYNKGLIDELYDIVPAVKPQCAYYEMYGWYGVRALAETIKYAKSKGMFVITDGKRNDIGTTMEAYAVAHLGETDIDGEKEEAFGGDALTVNGYLGSDGINPLITICEEKDKGIFVLVKTSNPSSGELQNLEFRGEETVYLHMGRMCEDWGKKVVGKYGYSGVGAVVGATYPEMGKVLRKLMPKTYILVPGYGAQGGTAKDLKPYFNEDGLGAIVNSSRGIIAAYKQDAYSKFGEENFADASREAVINMKNDINSIF
mgnify:CR=1 FL=1